MFWNAVNGRVKLNGTEMPYVSFGAGERKLIILPGLSDGLATVKGKAVLLAAPYRKYLDRYTVYMFSRPDPIPDGYSIREMAADQAAALIALGIDRACVLGVSEGGMIAQYLAIDHPELVEKLVIAVSAPCVNELMRGCLETWMAAAEKGDHRSLMIDTAERSYSEGYLKKYRRIYPVIGSVGRPSNYRRFLVNAGAILDFDATAELGAVSCPTLIIAGGDDRIVGAEASARLHEKIAGSELYVYPGLGHASYEEAPDFNERVFGFLDG